MNTAHTPSICFNPTPDQADRLIRDLCDPALSLHAIAESCGITLEALTLWMSRPDIQARLDDIESAACSRARRVASTRLTGCIDALSKVFDEFNASPPLFAARTGSQPPADPSAPPTPPTDIQIRTHLRTHELICRACTAFWRLCRFQPFAHGPGRSRRTPPSPRRPHPSELPPTAHTESATPDPELAALLEALHALTHDQPTAPPPAAHAPTRAAPAPRTTKPIPPKPAQRTAPRPSLRSPATLLSAAGTAPSGAWP